MFLETDASGVGFEATLLQTGGGTSCHRDEAPDNNVFRPIAFVSRSLLEVERRHGNIEKEVLATLHGLKKFHHY